jgi:hypothetical protein
MSLPSTKISFSSLSQKDLVGSGHFGLMIKIGLILGLLSLTSGHAWAQNLLLDVDKNSERKLISVEPANPQPSFEYKFVSWGSGFLVRLTRKQDGGSPTLAHLAQEWSDPDERKVSYSLGIQMTMPNSPEKDSRRLYSYLLNSSSGLIVDDLNQRLPILKMFSSGLNLSIDLMNPFEGEPTPVPETTFSYVLEDRKDGKDPTLVPLVVPRAPATKPTVAEVPSALPTWKFKGQLKPSFGAGPGLTITMNEVTGFYQIEKSLVGGSTFNQRLSIPIPGNRISTTFVANKAQMTETNPFYLQKGRSIKFQYFHIEKKNNVILAKDYKSGRVELVTTYQNQFSKFKSATLGYTGQI